MSEAREVKSTVETNGKSSKKRLGTAPQAFGEKVKNAFTREKKNIDQFQGNFKNLLKLLTYRKDDEPSMRVLIGRKAPNFKATAVFGEEFKEIELSQYAGKYVLLFFYPLDFTFVCPTELHAFQACYDKFQKRGVELLACSVDSQFSHLAWLKTAREKGGIHGVEYGVVSDLGGKIAHQYGILSDDGVAYRGLFLIDQQGIVRHQLVNDLPIGRSVDEALRTVDALQHVEKNGEVCPANWKKGEKAIHATPESVSDYLTSAPTH
jgi:peroxiredoxin (alkyl hydroperoxide reductase subunit C)